MAPGIPTKVIGVCAGLTAFSIAMVAGIAADNPAEDVLLRAILAMFACQLIGWIVGAISERIVREALKQYRQSHPINTSSTAGAATTVDAAAVAPGS